MQYRGNIFLTFSSNSEAFVEEMFSRYIDVFIIVTHSKELHLLFDSSCNVLIYVIDLLIKGVEVLLFSLFAVINTYTVTHKISRRNTCGKCMW